MAIQAIIEYNDKGFLVYADGFPGTFTRGREKSEAIQKLPREVEIYCRWAGRLCPNESTVNVIEEEYKDIAIEDADTEVLFESEKSPMSDEDYRELKSLVFKSAEDVLAVYNSIPDRNRPLMPPREAFHGAVDVTAREMLAHINGVTQYYITQIGVSHKNLPDLQINREAAFAALEKPAGFLDSNPVTGSFGEVWSLRKVLRRFIWHDRIHIKAMYRRANLIWEGKIKDPFSFAL